VPGSAPPASRTAAPVPAASGPALQPAATMPAVTTAPPPLPAPALKRRETPRPASPEPAAAAPAPEKQAPPPVEPAAAESEMPQDLPRLAGELVERSEKLAELYKDFLGKKEDGGAELTRADDQLKDEIDTLTAAADRFNKRVNERLFVRAWDRLKRQTQQEAIRRRAQDIAGSAGRIDQLVAQVQPSPEVRQEWQEVRRRWTRVAQLVSR
jgi:hypothetical protein